MVARQSSVGGMKAGQGNGLDRNTLTKFNRMNDLSARRHSNSGTQAKRAPLPKQQPER